MSKETQTKNQTLVTLIDASTKSKVRATYFIEGDFDRIVRKLNKGQITHELDTAVLEVTFKERQDWIDAKHSLVMLVQTDADYRFVQEIPRISQPIYNLSIKFIDYDLEDGIDEIFRISLFQKSSLMFVERYLKSLGVFVEHLRIHGVDLTFTVQETEDYNKDALKALIIRFFNERVKPFENFCTAYLSEHANLNEDRHLLMADIGCLLSSNFPTDEFQCLVRYGKDTWVVDSKSYCGNIPHQLRRKYLKTHFPIGRIYDGIPSGYPDYIEVEHGDMNSVFKIKDREEEYKNLLTTLLNCVHIEDISLRKSRGITVSLSFNNYDDYFEAVKIAVAAFK